MQRIATGYVDAQHPKAIDADLYRRYSETLRKAVELVGVDETLQDRWMANVSRFAAYKAADATRRIAEAVMENGALDDGLNPLHAHRRYLAAEANTARTRARTGKQWQQFNDDDRRRLFPNLRWVPSRSAMPREAHQLFWDKVWAKDDPFWQRNQPGTLWNCKCDWEETDDPVSTDEEKKLPNGRSVDDYTIKVRGLDGNPAETGQIFSDDASYIRNTTRKEKNRIEGYCCDKFVRRDIKDAIDKYMGTTVQADLRGQPIDVLFDGTTKSHIANDAVQTQDFLLSEISSRLPDILRQSKAVAHEENKKLQEKPSALHYYYFEYTIGGKTYYLNVEENFVEMEKRHFYRLYSVCTKLRETAIKY